MVSEQLEGGESSDQIISHEVKELGIHILVCVVTYLNSSGETKLLRKFFKFEVMKPLDVKTKHYNIGPDKLFLEAQIQNKTKNSIFMEKVNMEPSNAYTSKPLNSQSQNSDSQTDQSGLLNPDDVRQFVFLLQLKPEKFNLVNSEGASPIGKIDIVWRSNLGERGRLQTSQLQRTWAQEREVVVEAEEIEEEVVERREVNVRLKVTNLSGRERRVEVSTVNSENVVWLSLDGFKGGKLASKTSQTFTAKILATSSGVHSLGGVVVRSDDVTYEFDDIRQFSVAPQQVV